MKYLVVLALTPFVVACVAQAPVTPAALQSGVEGVVANVVGSGTSATALPIDDAASSRICKRVKRPGSNIADTVCYTRGEQLAKSAASKAAIEDLQNEQRWRDQAIEEALMKNRFPSAVGILR
jgi:hypothetical protein